jgi:hypothetical protein
LLVGEFERRWLDLQRLDFAVSQFFQGHERDTRDETLRYKKILSGYKLDLKGIKELTNTLMLKDKQVVQLQKRVRSLTVSQKECISQINEYDLLLNQFKNNFLGKDNLLLQKQTGNKEIV